MPELPEVEIVRKQLQERVCNKRIREVAVHDARVIKNVTAQKFIDTVSGRKITQIQRKGKVLLLSLTQGYIIVIHLRINGWIVLADSLQQYCRVEFTISPRQRVQICDSRVLGEVRILAPQEEYAFLAKLGPDPLEISAKEFLLRLGKKKGNIKSVLMDQSFVAGIGNIYAVEALFLSGVHPRRMVGTLTQQERKDIYKNLKKVVRRALRHGGSSVNTYRHLDGVKGTNAQVLSVYQREHMPCPACKTRIIRETISGRGTYFCPKCQR